MVCMFCRMSYSRIILAGFFELFRSEFGLDFAEINVVFVFHRDQVNVRMGNFEAENHYCHSFASDFRLDFFRHPFGEDDHPLQGFVVQVENIIDLFLGDDQRMTFLEGIDVLRNARKFSSSATL